MPAHRIHRPSWRAVFGPVYLAPFLALAAAACFGEDPRVQEAGIWDAPMQHDRGNAEGSTDSAIDTSSADTTDPTKGLHVSPKGSDSNNGSLDHPFKTIQKAADVAVAGDVVHIHAGSYDEIVQIKNSGEAGKYITFRGYKTDKVTLTAPGKTTWDGILGLFGNDYIKLEDIVVSGNKEGFGILIRHSTTDVKDAASYIELHRVEVKNVGDSGIQVRGNAHHILVEDCYTHNLGFTGVDISMWKGGITPHHVTVRNVTAHDCSFAGIGSEIANDLLIEKNKVSSCPSMGIDIGSGARNVVTGNTIDKVDTGIGLSSNVDSVVSHNKVSNISAEALYAYYWSNNKLPHARNRWHNNTVTSALRALYESCQKSDKYTCGDTRDHEYDHNTFTDVGFSWGNPVFYFEKVYNVTFHDNTIKKKTPSFTTMNIKDGDSYGSKVFGNVIQ